MHRRGPRKEPTPFAEAFDAIRNMERKVINALASTDGLTPDDFLDWLYPAEVLKLLRAAAPHAAIGSGLSTIDEFDMPLGNEVQFWVEFKKLNCVVPASGLVSLQANAPKADLCYNYVDTVCKIHQDYNKLRDIVAFFHKANVTPGGARHYWPTMQALLPKDHAFFKVSGERFKEAYFPLEIADKLREAPEIIAKGLICPDLLPIQDYGPLRIRANIGNIFYVFPEYIK